MKERDKNAWNSYLMRSLVISCVRCWHFSAFGLGLCELPVFFMSACTFVLACLCALGNSRFCRSSFPDNPISWTIFFCYFSFFICFVVFYHRTTWFYVQPKNWKSFSLPYLYLAENVCILPRNRHECNAHVHRMCINVFKYIMLYFILCMKIPTIGK